MFKMVDFRVSVRLLLGLTLIFTQAHGSYFFYTSSINCSDSCSCSDEGLESTLREHESSVAAMIGYDKYKSEILKDVAESGAGTTYSSILGMLTNWLHQVIRITCKLSDGKVHKASSLLNNVDATVFTMISVKCTKGERLIWDIAPTRTSLIGLNSDGCSFSASDKKRSIEIPMNAWIWSVDTPDHNIFDLTDIRYTMNTVSLSISGSRTHGVPLKWKDTFMSSASTISLQRNQFETFECLLRFPNALEALSIAHNKFTKFPSCLMDNRNVRLKYLSLSHNRIHDISILFEDIANQEPNPDIKIINLSHNDIEKLGPFRDMGRLLIIDLSYNKIKEIPNDAFINLETIEQIYLEHNKIHIVRPYAFTMNVKLSLLDLHGNDLREMSQEQLPTGVIGTRITVNLKSNNLKYTPFKNCARGAFYNPMIEISMSENPLNCDCRMMEFNQCTRWLDNLGLNNVSSSSVFKDVEDFTCASPREIAGEKVNNLDFLRSCVVVDNCPNKCSCVLENTNTLLVNCSSRRLMEMPDALPVVPYSVVKLHLSHNPLQLLSYRSYLQGLSELRMDNCLITTVTPAAISALQNIKILTLHNNLLQKLPASTRNITLNRATNVTLHNNRWECSCESLWLPRWLSKHKSALWMPGKILCNYLKKPVEDLSDMDLTCTSSAYLDTFLAVTLVFTSLISTLIIVFCYSTEISLLLYSKLGLRLGSNFCYGDMFHPYDAFVSYSQDNYKWVVDSLVPHLEDGERKYHLCLHYRDFPPGESVVDNIPWAIRLSRCSILVLSKDFLKREWCIMEVRSAFQRMLLAANRLIIIATDDISPEDLTPELQAYMNTHDYLRAGEPCFWEKLEMFLPPKPLPEVLQNASPVIGDSAGGDQSVKIEGRDGEQEDVSFLDPTEQSSI